MSAFIEERMAVIAIDFGVQLDSLKARSTLSLLKGFKLHLIHVTPSGPESKRTEGLHLLNNVRELFFHDFPVDQIESKCIFSEDRAQGICDYASRIGPDLIVLFSKKDSTGRYENEDVAQYLFNHFPASILIIRES